MSSELKDPGFHSRLSEVIGDEKPFAWAERVGISKGAFSRIWNDGTVPGPDHLRRIRETEKVSIDWLLTGEGHKKVDSAESKLQGYRDSIERLKERLRGMPNDSIKVGCIFGDNRISYDEARAFIQGKYSPGENQLIELCRIAGSEFNSPDFMDSITNIKIPYLEKKVNLDISLLKCVYEVVEELDKDDNLLSIEQKAELVSLVYYMNQGTKYTKKRLFRFIEAICVFIEQGLDLSSVPGWKMSNIIKEVAHHVVKGGEEGEAE